MYGRSITKMEKYFALTQEMKNNADFFGNAAYFFVDGNCLRKIYMDSIDMYETCTIFPIGIQNEAVMYQQSVMQNYSFVPKYYGSDIGHLTLSIEYLRDYVTIRDYIRMYFTNVNQDLFFQSVCKLLYEMKQKSFVHGNLCVDKVMIHPTTLDMKVIDLKNSYEVFGSWTEEKLKNFTHERNHLLYDIFRLIHPEYSSLLHKYFMYRYPDYYTNGNGYIGKFYSMAISRLFRESGNLNDIDNNQFVDFIQSFVEYRNHLFNLNPYQRFL